jgi:hypothetical protein
MIPAKSLSAVLALVGSVALALVCTAAGSPPPPAGPYKVVVSKPIQSPGHTVGTLYKEHQYLTEMMNQLDKDGLRPVLTELLRNSFGGAAEDVRMLVVCLPK